MNQYFYFVFLRIVHLRPERCPKEHYKSVFHHDQAAQVVVDSVDYYIVVYIYCTLIL